MSKSVLTQSRFKLSIHQAVNRMRQVTWYLNEVEVAADAGDERSVEFLKRHGSLMLDMQRAQTSWSDECQDIIDSVEKESALRDGKVHCELCSKNVSNLREHARRSVSHKGRLRVKNLDKNPDWHRVGDSKDRVMIDILLESDPPKGTEIPQWEWTPTQRSEFNKLSEDRKNSMSDILTIQPYQYHSSGKEKRHGGTDCGKYWMHTNIRESIDSLYVILNGLVGSRLSWHSDRLKHPEFRKVVDKIIRNPNEINRHAAMYALQLDSKED